MILDYIGVKEINGSLIILDDVENASFEEVVDIRLMTEPCARAELCKWKATALLFRFLKAHAVFLLTTLAQD